VAAAEAGQDTERWLQIEAATLNFLAADYAASGAAKAIARDYFIELMERQGHPISLTESPIDKELQAEIKQIKHDIWQTEGATMARLDARMSDRHYRELPRWQQALLDRKRTAITQFPGVDFNCPDRCYKALVADYGKVSREVLLFGYAEHPAAVQGIEQEQVIAILKRQIRLPHQLPRQAVKAKLLERLGVLFLLDAPYSNTDERAIRVKQEALKWAKEIRDWLALNVSEEQSPVEICNKLLKRLGIKAKAIARPGTDRLFEKRDRIYQALPYAEPLQLELLEAVRRRLGTPVVAPPSVDEVLSQKHSSDKRSASFALP
jgi:hypothetical protein